MDMIQSVIDPYLTEKDTLSLVLVSKTTQSLFQPALLQKMANKLLLLVMHGEQENAKKLLKMHPKLLLMTGIATDYSGRTFETTAFRYALWALDTRYMCNMMLDCLPYGLQGDAIKQGLLDQYQAQEQDGLNYKLNGVIINETHYNFSPIKSALQTYINHYDNWYVTRNWSAMQIQWSTAVGLAQRYLPAHVAQHYCDPDKSFDPIPLFNKKIFNRSLEFHNAFTDTKQFWVAPVSSTSGLGVAFGITEKGQGVIAGGGVRGERGSRALTHLRTLTALCEARTRDLVPLMRRLEGLIQEVDVDLDMHSCACCDY